VETRSEFIWKGLTLSRRTLLTGTDLEPKYALIKARRVLDDHRGHPSGDPSQGELTFDEGTPVRLSVPGLWIPADISGEVRAEAVPDGIAVTASTNLLGLFVGVVVSLIGIRLFFGYVGLTDSIVFAIALALVPAGTALYLWEAARVLRGVTTAATTL
jgi:hypothetical protein